LAPNFGFLSVLLSVESADFEMNSSIEAELKSQAISCIENCLELLHSGTQDAEKTVIIRVESLLQVLLEVENYQAVWLDNVIQLLEEIIYNAEGDLFVAMPPGRPRSQVRVSTIEFLLAQRFSVPKISKMLCVSTRTIFRRLQENGITVKYQT